jgi:hypothetical protein
MQLGAEINETPMTPPRVRRAIEAAMAKKRKVDGVSR